MTVQLTVIGLNQIGLSIGMAIKAGASAITCVACDQDISKGKAAVKAGAFDRAVFNLQEAVENADIVVLCLSVDEIRKTIEVIAPALKSGAVVLDTSVLKSPVQNWAEPLFPEDRYLLGFYPALNPDYLAEPARDPLFAHADLFQRSIVMISASDSTHPDAVRLASEFATLLGARSYFSDPIEAEGLTALVHHLPQVAAAALCATVTSQPGWREGQKIGGKAFLQGSSPLQSLDEDKDLGQALLYNSQNQVRLIDAYIEELHRLREMILRQDAEALRKTLQKAVDGQEMWINRRQSRNWDAIDASEEKKTGSWLVNLFGAGRPSKDQDDRKS